MKNLFSERPQPDPSEVFMELRNRVFALNPTEVGIVPSPECPVLWGVLTEFGQAGGAATIVSLADGTTSMYTSSGGGLIGAGQHEGPAQATRALLRVGEKFVEKMERTSEFPLPSPGTVRFYALTFSGIRTVEFPDALTEKDRVHPFYELYACAQDVVTQIRLLSE